MDKDKKRFFDKVKKTDNCWEWIGARHPKGYGLFNYKPGTGRAHRVSWILHYGDIPDKLHCLHRCDNPSCVNPEHLFLGTNQDNVDDKIKKNRQASNVGEANPRAKLTEDDVKKIRTMTGTQTEIAFLYGIDQTTVSEIKRRKRWSHI